MDLALIRDLLDEQLVDRNNEPLGRVDGIVMTWQPDAPPRVTHLELGGTTLAQRLPRPVRGWMLSLARRFSPRGAEPYRIEVTRIMRLGRNIQIDIESGRSAAHASERWVRDHIIARIPGS